MTTGKEFRERSEEQLIGAAKMHVQVQHQQHHGGGHLEKAAVVAEGMNGVDGAAAVQQQQGRDSIETF